MDINYNLHSLFHLLQYSSMFSSEEYAKTQIARIKSLIKSGEPIYLYGAGVNGADWLEALRMYNANVVGFFDQRYNEINSYCNLPVFAPPEKGFCGNVLVGVYGAAAEVQEYLLSMDIPQKNIFPLYDHVDENFRSQYFDFLDAYIPGGLFIDAGCFDCGTSIYFIEQTGDTTASIVAFEPDPINAEHCRRIAREHNLNIQLIEAGAYSEDGVLHFNSSGSSMSCIEENGSISVNIRTIDNVVGDQRVSFIKVDIEGSELEALKGASKCIQRDKPICAISAYHRIGDTIVLLNYLKELVPEYCFALRHYSNSSCETVLYAFIKQ